jgi:hypothetical protein
MFRLLTNSLFVAICHSKWLHNRKYGTVWYHPASSRFYLTIFILCQFPGKLTGTLPNSDARATCVKLVIRLAVCLAWGADFMSTHFLARSVGPSSWSRCLKSKLSWMSPSMNCLQNINYCWKRLWSSSSRSVCCLFPRIGVVWHSSRQTFQEFWCQERLMPLLLQRNKRLLLWYDKLWKK